jgi:ribosomal protein L40E
MEATKTCRECGKAKPCAATDCRPTRRQLA